METRLAILPESADALKLELGHIIIGAYNSLVEAIRVAAPIVMQLDSMRVNLDDMPLVFIQTARKVGAGLLMPELVPLIGTTPLIQRVLRLPVAIQKQAIEDATVRVIDPTKPDADNVRCVPMSKLTPMEIEIVFSESGVRSIESQITEARAKAQAAARRNATPEVQPRVVKVGRGYKIAGYFRTRAELEAEINAIS